MEARRHLVGIIGSRDGGLLPSLALSLTCGLAGTNFHLFCFYFLFRAMAIQADLLDSWLHDPHVQEVFHTVEVTREDFELHRKGLLPDRELVERYVSISPNYEILAEPEVGLFAGRPRVHCCAVCHGKPVFLLVSDGAHPLIFTRSTRTRI